MKRLLQALALLQVLLVVGLAVRIVSVWTTPLPEFPDVPELPAPAPLPPPKPVASVSEAVTSEVVENDLFDDERGQGQSGDTEGVTIEAAPVPPPSTVKLMGVMLLGREPVAILLDTNVKPEQQSVRKGDMFGEYEIGDITAAGLTLLGGAGQQFQIPLRVESGSGSGSGSGVAAAPAPRTPGAASGATRPAPAAGRPVAARPVPQRNAPAPAPAAAEEKTMSARERAQAIAQRNAELRKTGGRGAPAGAPAGARGETEAEAPDPVQARLEALRQLREAAKSR